MLEWLLFEPGVAALACLGKPMDLWMNEKGLIGLGCPCLGRLSPVPCVISSSGRVAWPCSSPWWQSSKRENKSLNSLLKFRFQNWQDATFPKLLWPKQVPRPAQIRGGKKTPLSDGKNQRVTLKMVQISQVIYQTR